MDLFEQALAGIPGGWVLDVATGQGRFVERLAGGLAGYTAIVGVDVAERMLRDAAGSATAYNAHFVQMDARRLGFPDDGFDTVSISASLHHVADAPSVLLELRRMLRPGGHLIVAEMHRDAATEAQVSSVRLHTWAAAVDLAVGLPHYPTLARQQIVDLVAALDLRNVSVYDWVDLDSDPHDPDRLRALEGVLARYLSRAQGLPDYAEIEAQAEALRRRLRRVGAQSEPRVVLTAQRRC
jgi:SAM-dependent methyltransferase